MRIRFLTIGAAAVAVMLGVAVVDAQRPFLRERQGARGPAQDVRGGGPGGPGGGPQFGPMRRGRGGPGFGPAGALGPGLAWALDLTDAQKEALAGIRKTANDAAQPIHESLRTAERDLRNAIFAETFDAKVVADLAQKVDGLRDQLDAIHLKAETDTAATLTAEQRTKMKDAPGRRGGRGNAGARGGADRRGPRR
ncbi:MAG: Spy/CpxP family protein refolding chaperone [Vicinamibacterales bacterium]